jgi:hypothetical protein
MDVDFEDSASAGVVEVAEPESAGTIVMDGLGILCRRRRSSHLANTNATRAAAMQSSVSPI